MDFTVADPHFCPRGSGHYANITRYEDRPDGWDELIVRLWNETVSGEDRVLVLGDFALASLDFTREVLARLNGRKLLVLGNHDGNRSRMLAAGFEEVYGSRGGAKYGNPEKGVAQFWLPWTTNDGYRVALSHAPLPELPRGCMLNFHGHIHSQGYPAEIGGQRPWHRNVAVEVLGYRPVPLSYR